MNHPLSIYVHIPFCTTKCTYCAFNTYTHLEHLIKPFLAALIREAEIAGRGAGDYVVETIYFGGGTPSLLTAAQVSGVLEALRRHYAVSPDAEISLESNPNDLDEAYLAGLRAAGVNRLSIGMQSAAARELRLFDRRHDAEAVVHAMRAARAAGFENVNLDLIYGVPAQKLSTWRSSMAQAIALEPEHVSLYALGLEDGTPMKTWVERGQLSPPDDDLAAEMYELASGLLAAAGYEQYEISNWGRPGYACRHNLQYWRNGSYLGLGPGAHGFAVGVRYETLRFPARYIDVLNAPAAGSYEFPRTPATAQATVVDREAEIAETLIMGLRLTLEGIERAGFLARFGVDVVEWGGGRLEKFARYGLLCIEDDRVRLTQRGRLLCNVIFRELV